MSYGGAIFGWPAGDPVERFNAREARIESYQNAIERREHVGEAVRRGTGNWIVLPEESELSAGFSERAIVLPTIEELERAARE